MLQLANLEDRFLDKILHVCLPYSTHLAAEMHRFIQHDFALIHL
jgi:hypothetical protein